MQRFGDRPSPDALVRGNALCERHRPLASHPKRLGVLPHERRVGRGTRKRIAMISADPAKRALSGSPSQIEWAEAIRTRVADEFDRVAASFRSIAHRQTPSKKSDTEAILAILEDKR